MGYEMKLLKHVRRAKQHNLGLFIVVVCFIFTTAFLSLSKTTAIPILGFRLTNRFPEYQTAADAEHSKHSIQNQKKKPLCDFSNPRSDTCEMAGDVRIHGNSSSVVLIIPSQSDESSWTIQPHARKADTFVMRHVTSVSVRSSLDRNDSPRCTVNHNVPAVVFSTGGYMGNMFHDFTDVLIPLFITSRRFDREVQFLVTDTQAWWLTKFKPYLNELSRYKIIDFDKDSEVRCYPRTILGLMSHKEMSIDPSRAPEGCSMLEFGRFMRKSFSLERESAVKLGNNSSAKPRLMIIARNRTRMFENVDEIAELAEGLGYEVMVAEADVSSNLTQFARVVNSCDVLMGVHGAGLTNLVFLPTNAAVVQLNMVWFNRTDGMLNPCVQVVPLGGLEKIAREDFGVPAQDMGMKYLQYSISEEESTLVDVYPREHAVFKDPFSIQRKGWMAFREVYLDKQNVRIHMERFKGILVKALELLF